MIDKVVPYFYQGHGEILVAERGIDGTVGGYLDLGRVSEVMLRVSDKVKVHTESMTPEAAQDARVILGTEIELEMKVDHVSKENLQLLMRMFLETVPAGSAVFSRTVYPGYRYPMPNIKLSNFVMKNLAGSITYTEGRHYDLHEDRGSLSILSSQPSVNPIVGDMVTIAYDHDEYSVLDYGASKNLEYSLRFEGLNIAEDNSPVVLECYRVGMHLLSQFKVQGSQSSFLTVRGTLLKDTFRPEGSQFFREILV